MYYAYNRKCKDAYSYSYMHVRSLQREFFYMSIISSRVIRFQMKSVFSIFLLGTKCQSMESIESTAVKMPGETLTLSCRASGSQSVVRVPLVVCELRLVVRRGISELNINQAACPPKRFF